MNKYQEALERVEQELGRRPTVSLVLTNKHINDLRELVRRATPKKPISLRVGYLRLGSYKGSKKIGYCPKCGERVDDLDFPYMCSRKGCGQQLDWSNDA